MIEDMYYGLTKREGISFRDISPVLTDLGIRLSVVNHFLPTRYDSFLLSSKIIIPATERIRVGESLELPHKTNGASHFYYAFHDWDPTIIKERLTHMSIDSFFRINFKNNYIVERTEIWFRRGIP